MLKMDIDGERIKFKKLEEKEVTEDEAMVVEDNNLEKEA